MLSDSSLKMLEHNTSILLRLFACLNISEYKDEYGDIANTAELKKNCHFKCSLYFHYYYCCYFPFIAKVGAVFEFSSSHFLL